MGGQPRRARNEFPQPFPIVARLGGRQPTECCGDHRLRVRRRRLMVGAAFAGADYPRQFRFRGDLMDVFTRTGVGQAGVNFKPSQNANRGGDRGTQANLGDVFCGLHQKRLAGPAPAVAHLWATPSQRPLCIIWPHSVSSGHAAGVPRERHSFSRTTDRLFQRQQFCRQCPFHAPSSELTSGSS
jgi:hypothetical protein